MTTPITTITAMVVHLSGVNPCFGEDVIEIRMIDEGGGAFFELRQEGDGLIRADLEDLVALVAAAQQMLKQQGLTP